MGGGAPVCGDGARGGVELCDGQDLGNKTCAAAVGQAATGVLACKSDCKFDTSGCHYCGDGTVDNGEECDGSVGAVTCATLVGAGSVGAISCSTTCTYRTSACSAPASCGDGALNNGEACDGANLGGKSCSDALNRPATGTPTCRSNCTLDLSQCHYCGDGAVDAGEACDGDVGVTTCAAAVGAGSQGKVVCSASCALDTSGCSAAVSCGDGKRNGTEACDGADLGGASCATAVGQGATGSLTCKADCSLDVSACRYCGDGVVTSPESCDGGVGAATCASVVGTGSTGTLACSSLCKFDSAGCTPPASCGDGVINAGESCDGPSLGANTCATATGKPAATGDLACKTNCTLDLAGCHFCGDGAVDSGEACDGGVGTATCASVVGAGSTGTLSCGIDCKLNTSACSAPPVCGDGVKNGNDACDGGDLGGATCTSVVGKPATGAPTCQPDCTLSPAGCHYCGDGAIDGGESCDGATLGSATCASVVGAGSVGTLKCASTCAFDTSGCSAPPSCGDGVKNGSEACDTTDYGGATCASVVGKSSATGSLLCNGQCAFDTSGCQYCGNGQAQGSEACDGADLKGASCSQLGAGWVGTVTCDSACALNMSACTCGAQTSCNGVCRDLQTDPNNCGACGRQCGVGTCVGGLCAPVTVTSATGVAALDCDDTNVYVAGTGGVYRVSILEGEMTMWDTSTTGAHIQLQSGYVYFDRADGSSSYLARRVAWNGKIPEDLTSNPATEPLGVFRVVGSKLHLAGGSNGVVCNLNGANCAYMNFITSLKVGDGLNGTFYYVAADDTIRRRGLDAATLYSGEVAVKKLRAESDGLFWAKGSSLVKGSLSGSPAPQTFAVGAAINDFSLAPGIFYWATASAVERMNTDGTNRRVLASSGASLVATCTSTYLAVWSSSDNLIKLVSR